MGVTALLITALMILTSPLSEAARTALETAVDGQELRFNAAIEMLLREPAAESPAALDDDAEWNELIAAPDEFRGVPFRLEGAVLSRKAEVDGFSNAEVWLIEPHSGPDHVVVVSPEDLAPVNDRPTVVAFSARFAMWAETPVRTQEGAPNSLATPVFVGSVIAVTPIESISYESPIWIVCIFACIVAFIVAKAWSRRSVPAPSRFTGLDDSADEALGELPEEPADALAELHRRSDVN